MIEIVDVTGIGQDGVFLIKGRENFIFEAGMAYAADVMVECIKKELAGEELHGVLLSHSHYDHVAGLPAIRREWPGVKVYASHRAKEILVKPSVLSVIRRLSREAAEASGRGWDENYRDEDLRVDIGISDREKFRIGEHEIEALETIGHTKCSISYIVDGELMLCSETVGVMNRQQEYMPSFLVDYRMAEASIERSGRIPVKTVLLNHYGIVPEEDRPRIWEILLEKLRESKRVMLKVMNTYDTDEACLKELERIFHAKVDKKLQPDEAFYINAASMMKTLRRQFPEELRG